MVFEACYTPPGDDSRENFLNRDQSAQVQMPNDRAGCSGTLEHSCSSAELQETTNPAYTSSGLSADLVPPINGSRRKRPSSERPDSESDDLESVFTNNSKRSNIMEVEEKCARCELPLAAISLLCSVCRRKFHGSCKSQDEVEPNAGPGAVWKCRVCSIAAAPLNHEQFMNVLDNRKLDNDVANYNTLSICSRNLGTCK